MKFAALLLEIRKRVRVLPSRSVDPLQEIMRRIKGAPHSAESKVLGRIAAAVCRGSGTIDEDEIWSLSQEALGLLDALIERRIA